MLPSMKNFVRGAFAAVILLELFGSFLLPDIASDFTWLGLVVTALFAWTVMEFFSISVPVIWITLIAVVFDGISALMDLYSRIEPWDIFVHILGGAVIATAALDLVLRALKKEHIKARRQGALVMGAAYLLVVAIGFLYEFWEYLVNKLQYGYPKSLVSAYDSIEDQLANLLGATLVLIAYKLWTAKRQRASR